MHLAIRDEVKALAALAALAMVVWLACCVPAHASAPTQAPTPAMWMGVVTYVVDGDTVWVRPADGGKPVSVRVDGIDAPEICQPGGGSSRDALKRRVQDQRIAVFGRRHDDYGRLLARLELNGDDLGQWMVSQGQAWSYHYGRRAGPYALQQSRAKAAGLGLFSPSHAAMPPVYPRAFRKQHGPCHA